LNYISNPAHQRNSSDHDAARDNYNIASPPLQPDDIYPTSPGWTEATTSKEAADLIKPTAARVRERVLNLITAQPNLSVHQISHQLELSIATVQPRVSELRRMGEIKASGQRSRNESGMSAHCWVRVSEPTGGVNVE
jgi:hypothetical protein